MFKTIFLLTPVYVTLFWAVVLHTDQKKRSAARTFLGKFMIIAFVVYVSHFAFYSGYEQSYLYLDPLYHLASLLVFPLYHIYFRLLTIDPKFSVKKHSIYLIAPILLSAAYLIAILALNHEEYSHIVYEVGFKSEVNGQAYLLIIRYLMSICFIAQVILTVIGNFILIQKYGMKAKHYYSDMEDVSTARVLMLNYSMVITGLSSIVLASLGRGFFSTDNRGLAIASIIFSSMLFIIGWLGDRQKLLNPTFDQGKEETEIETGQSVLQPTERALLEKINQLFVTEKKHLNSKLNIMDVATAVGSNRTYISFLINKSTNQNFCSYVNQYRINELEIKISEQANASYHELAELCGFGSVDSMKRSVHTKTGQTLKGWRDSLQQ